MLWSQRAYTGKQSSEILVSCASCSSRYLLRERAPCLQLAVSRYSFIRPDSNLLGVLSCVLQACLEAIAAAAHASLPMPTISSHECPQLAPSQPPLQSVLNSASRFVTELAINTLACRTLARTNHSCCNNASYHFKADGTVIMRAVASITEGSEITISYVDLLESSGPRQCALWERYAFHCTCARSVESW